MVFMDYRESLRGAVETTYTDESGRPMLKLVEYGAYRNVAYSTNIFHYVPKNCFKLQNWIRAGVPTGQHVC